MLLLNYLPNLVIRNRLRVATYTPQPRNAVKQLAGQVKKRGLKDGHTINNLFALLYADPLSNDEILQVLIETLTLGALLLLLRQHCLTGNKRVVARAKKLLSELSN